MVFYEEENINQFGASIIEPISGQGEALVWIDASDTSSITVTGNDVDQINDKTGNGNNMVASGSVRPQSGVHTRNGNNVLTFDGVDDRLAKTGASADMQTLFEGVGGTLVYVFVPISFVDADQFGQGAIGLLRVKTSPMGAFRFRDEFTTSFGQWEVSSDVVQENNVFKLILTFVKLSSNNPTIRINGSNQSVTEVNTPSGDPSAQTAFYISGFSTVPEFRFCELIAYKGVKSGADLTAIDTHLNDKWGS